TLAVSNLTNWNVQITDGSLSAVMTPRIGIGGNFDPKVQGDGLTATKTHLLFDYSAPQPNTFSVIDNIYDGNIVELCLGAPPCTADHQPSRYAFVGTNTG